jgi:hypothetical protein
MAPPTTVVHNGQPSPGVPQPVAPGLGHLIPVQPSSVAAMYNAWYGLEDYAGIPVPGGIEKMEQQHKMAWRAHLTTAEKKHFSRFSIVIKSVKQQVTNGRELNEVLLQFDNLFTAVGKRSISTFCNVLRVQGMSGARQRNIHPPAQPTDPGNNAPALAGVHLAAPVAAVADAPVAAQAAVPAAAPADVLAEPLSPVAGAPAACFRIADQCPWRLPTPPSSPATPSRSNFT